MNQEEKQLLLKDLCSRLPYGVMVENIFSQEIFNLSKYLHCLPAALENFKPYLRPMSSMTEKEERIYLKLRAHALPFAIVEWLDKNHFDHRTNKDGETLIEIGLAYGAKEGMY